MNERFSTMLEKKPQTGETLWEYTFSFSAGLGLTFPKLIEIRGNWWVLLGDTRYAILRICSTVCQFDLQHGSFLGIPKRTIETVFYRNGSGLFYFHGSAIEPGKWWMLGWSLEEEGLGKRMRFGISKRNPEVCDFLQENGYFLPNAVKHLLENHKPVRACVNLQSCSFSRGLGSETRGNWLNMLGRYAIL